MPSIYHWSEFYFNRNGRFIPYFYFSGTMTERGSAATACDYDRDGDLDILTNGRWFYGEASGPHLLRNDGNYNWKYNWIQVKLLGTRCNRDAIGARIRCVAGNLKQIREVNGGKGFCTLNSHWMHFGLKNHQQIDSLIIQWPGPDFTRSVYTDIPARGFVTITEGDEQITLDIPDDKRQVPTTIKTWSNPFKERLFFTVEGLDHHQPLTILDTRGRKVAILNSNTDGIYMWDGTEEPAGLYFISTGKVHKRIIKIKQ
jgi:hypothetical protein